MDPVCNCQKDRFIAFRDINDKDRIITTTKHPASVMSLGFVASNGMAAPLIWFPAEFRLTVADYIKVLESNFIPWVKANFLNGNMVLQQDGAPAHMAKKSQEFLKASMDFWSKDMWPPYSPDANPLDFAF